MNPRRVPSSFIDDFRHGMVGSITHATMRTGQNKSRATPESCLPLLAAETVVTAVAGRVGVLESHYAARARHGRRQGRPSWVSEEILVFQQVIERGIAGETYGHLPGWPG